ncbi:MAG: type II toxin-antitoxin system RelE/ParE family toxin [Jaaginema sp. PMC 1079.18]|nr:type II toxin-antitoxin system RelE/ParE family toxin [Jaaginema sp. PMC 1080.18]MEC4851482.1 type II toxin-antitoxin system RelE/ParE family toxin [Jaaginema sp. PMC 1079.18]MEC4867833.1 type II toxin-antitoxin system RelE/ParE family toxin [Jaaginema sp. PMC 1078.18]
MPVIIIKPLAESDLVKIWQFIAEQNPEGADRILDQIDRQISRLAAMPSMGKQQEKILSGLRSFPVKNYVIFYFLIRDGVEIVRVLHGARDVETIFEEMDE